MKLSDDALMTALDGPGAAHGAIHFLNNRNALVASQDGSVTADMTRNNGRALNADTATEQ